MTAPSAESLRHDIDIQQLAREVRSLRGIVISVLVMTLVFLTVLSLHEILGISRDAMLFEELLAGAPLPVAARITLELGRSPLAFAVVALAAGGALTWLWLDRNRPAAPIFAILCLCAFLMVLLIWIRLSLAVPIQQIATGL